MSFSEFFNAYVECALWSSTDESRDDGGDPLDLKYSAADLSDETRAAMQADCHRFYDKWSEKLDHAESSPQWSNALRAGHDFWLTRRAATYGEINLYVGDDGRIYHA